jgi:hypothetical protein
VQDRVRLIWTRKRGFGILNTLATLYTSIHIAETNMLGLTAERHGCWEWLASEKSSYHSLRSKRRDLKLETETPLRV